VQDRHAGERLRASGDDHVVVTEHDLIGGVGDGLVRRRTCPADRVGLTSARQHRHQGDFARDVRRDHRRDDRAVHDRLDVLAVEVRPLNELGNAPLAEVDGRHVFERRTCPRERRSDSCHDRYAAARRAQ
jgi:hypothetical protein